MKPRTGTSALAAAENGIRNARRELRRRDISPEARAGWTEKLSEWQREADDLRKGSAR